MAILKRLNGIEPKIGKNCFLAENAVIVGDVTIGDDCSIWYGAVLRGDVNPIIIGNRVNIVLLFVWAFSGDTNENKKNYCKAQLIILAIILGINIIVLIITGISMLSFMRYY